MNGASKALSAPALLALFGLASSCHRSTSPSCTDQYGRGDTALNLLNISCQTIETQLRCQSVAEVSGLYVYCGRTADETQAATWTANNPAILKRVAPGVFEAVGSGDTFVKAAWNNLESVAQPVAVFSGGPPLPTGQLWGDAYSAGGTPGPNPIDGVTVQILDGSVAGRTAVTGTPPSPIPPGFITGPGTGPGAFFILGVPAGTYHVRVSKPGFAIIERELTLTASYDQVEFAMVPQ